MSLLDKERQAVLATAQALLSSGLTVGRSGNVSVRCAEGCLITPSGVPYEQLFSDDIVLISLQGEVLEGSYAPSSEWRLHTEVYRQRNDISAVVHAHPRYSTALACTGREIPAFHYMVAAAGGNCIPCAEYATFGTQALSDHALRALQGLRACLLANHGMLSLGASLPQALELAHTVEDLASQYCQALQLGDVTILSAAQMQEVHTRFRQGYGQAKR